MNNIYLGNLLTGSLFLFLFTVTEGLLRCVCNAEDQLCRNGTCHTDGVCMHNVVKTNHVTYQNLNCLALNLLNPVDHPLICQTSEPAKYEFAIECCDTDYCNRDLSPQVFSLKPQHDNKRQDQLELVAMIVVPMFILSIIIVSLYIFYRRFKNNRNLLIKQQDFEIKKLLDEFSCSGSGAGFPLLVQRTIARQIQTEVVIGKGRYGEVWMGRWRDEPVAIKIFHTLDEQSWKRESQIYQTNMLRHENILGFIAADNKDSGTWTQLWLVTDYYEHGSLYDYLNDGPIMNTTNMLLMIQSIIAGLSHLHIEIFGTQGKPAIAHRDLKSKNILVKNDRSCCIADLGLAVKHYSASDLIDVADNTRIGTVRYMAPEALDQSMDRTCFESYKQVDIYALALVIWEISNRTELDGFQTEYAAPYHEDVTPDPSIEAMKKVVCIQQLRPKFHDRFAKNSTLDNLTTLVEESWCQNASERLTLLRIKKTIATCLANLDIKKEIC